MKKFYLLPHSFIHSTISTIYWAPSLNLDAEWIKQRSLPLWSFHFIESEEVGVGDAQ